MDDLRSHSIDDEPESGSGGAWAIPILAFGLGLIAFAMIIPATDEQAALADERDHLRAQLKALQAQRDRNADFLQRIHGDPELARRLVERQRPGEVGRWHRDDQAVADAEREGVEIETAPAAEEVEDEPAVAVMPVSAGQAFASSPFALLAADPMAMPQPRRPLGGRLADWCRSPRTRLAVIGVGGFACLTGLLGGGSRRESPGA